LLQRGYPLVPVDDQGSLALPGTEHAVRDSLQNDMDESILRAM
jgi:hypothetical protein